MEKEHIFLLIFSFFALKPIAGANDDCLPASCSSREPEVRFPFRLIGHQPARCGFPGFDLSCDQQNQTIIQLPSSLPYVVNRISYLEQTDYVYPGYVPSNCEVMKTIELPVQRNGGDIRVALELMWFTPYCKACEREGKVCRLKSGDWRTICVSSSHGKGLSRGAKYGLSIGIGVPALTCIVGLVCYASSKVQNDNSTRNQSIELSSVVNIPQPSSRKGLDTPTIESYPKTVFGESCGLPNDDTTCAICLSDYKLIESLRTIPECNHYFHSECIDEWLKLNATCPVCRNMP
ncbi:hypothetical protein L2E82_06498 [Cichorium intybus]|uniref:Uncharacterized protein n=1 Tax=Cichorium intybus TaxID=13427 RepID=A0ACB9HA54_CICIN|nr:hypothetical protein L2E82_06498 [Cichorium intybus]